jgi:hypothetical protein
MLMIATGTVAVGAALILLGSQELPWTNQAEAGPRHSHNHSHEGLTWPPQPRGIANVVVHSDSKKEENERAIKKARMDGLALKAERGILGLGNRFARITEIEKDEKEDNEDRDRNDQEERNIHKVVNQVVFFSHDKNATIEVGFDGEDTIAAVTSTPASEYQPEITDEEIEAAQKLARKYFTAQGSKRIAGLRAYGILGYKPEGKGFFDTRVIYVSFHKHDDAPPELMAWVDLTNQRILQVGEEL